MRAGVSLAMGRRIEAFREWGNRRVVDARAWR